MNRVLTLSTLLLALSGAAYAGAEIGKPAPDFTATDIDGKTHRLSDFKGKMVVLEAYNHDCPYCANHYTTGAMQELQAELTGKGLVWLVVNSCSQQSGSYRDPAAARKEWKDLQIKATAWLDDHSGQLGKLYGMQTTPHLFVIDPNGVLAYQGAIDDKPATEGDPRKARNYVREAVSRLLAGQKVEASQTKPYGCSVKYAN